MEKKNYIIPEIKVESIEINDIILVSGTPTAEGTIGNLDLGKDKVIDNFRW